MIYYRLTAPGFKETTKKTPDEKATRLRCINQHAPQILMVRRNKRQKTKTGPRFKEENSLLQYHAKSLVK